MSDTLTLEEIREHWEEAGRALVETEAVTPTSRDPQLAVLERENVLAFLPPDGSLLEVGCGDAVHTVAYARAAAHLVALDVAESLAARARARLGAEGVTNTECVVASALDLTGRFGPAAFDAVISQRCLINLPDWPLQQQALEEIRQVLKPGGMLLMTEGFNEPFAALNAVRAGLGLDPLEVVPYNRMFDRQAFEAFIESGFEIVEVRNYGMYLLLSRTLHPLAIAPDAPRHDGPINQAALALVRAIGSSACEEYSYNLFYALRRRP